MIIIIICLFLIYSIKVLQHNKKRIAILIISTREPSFKYTDLYQIQRKTWIQYYNNDPNIDFFLLNVEKKIR